MRCLAAIFALCSLASAQTLGDRFEKIAEQAQGRVGAVAVVLEGGDNNVTCIRCDEKFPMQSVYKFPIGMAALAEVDAGKLKLQQEIPVYASEYPREGLHSPLRDKNKGRDTKVTVRELLRLAVSESDSTASDVLMRLSGGASGVMEYMKSLGVTGIHVQDTEFALGTDNQLQYRNWMSPRGALQLLRAFHEGKGLSKESRELLSGLLSVSVRAERRLKGALPREARLLGHKSGTSGTRNGITAATNDIGMLQITNKYKTIAVAVFVSDSRADEWTRERVIAEIAREAWVEFVLAGESFMPGSELLDVEELLAAGLSGNKAWLPRIKHDAVGYPGYETTRAAARLEDPAAQKRLLCDVQMGTYMVWDILNEWLPYIEGGFAIAVYEQALIRDWSRWKDPDIGSDYLRSDGNPPFVWAMKGLDRQIRDGPGFVDDPRKWNEYRRKWTIFLRKASALKSASPRMVARPSACRTTR